MTRGRILARLSGELTARDHDEVAEIVANLRNLFNSRQGAPTAPEFGLLDFNDLAHNFPDALRVLKSHVHAQIRRYEPRLRDVVVSEVECVEPMKVQLRIAGRLATSCSRRPRDVSLTTSFEAGGRISVKE